MFKSNCNDTLMHMTFLASIGIHIVHPLCTKRKQILKLNDSIFELLWKYSLSHYTKS